MNYFLALAAVLTVVGSVTCDIGDNPKELYDSINTQYLKNYLKQRQALNNLTARVEEVCPGKGEEFEGAFMKVKECADEIEESQETVCSAIRNHFLKCSRPMVKVLEDCFPEESKYIPDTIFRSIQAVTQYVCKADGEHIFELMNSCIMKPSYRLSRCERKIRVKTQQFQRSMPTKAEFCDFAHSFKFCIQGHLQSACGNQITREAALALYDALISPCSDVNEVKDTMTDVEMF